MALGYPSARAEDEAPAALAGEALRKRVERWIGELRSDEFEVREAARAGLRQHGSAARDLLEAAKDDEDPEVRRTVRALLSDTRGNPARPSNPVQAGEIDTLGLVTLVLDDVPLEAALAEVGRQMGARFDVPADAKARRVSHTAKAQPCFAALRAVLEAGGVRMAKTFGATGRVALSEADDTPVPPWAAAGPLLVEIVEVSATRALDAVRPPRYALKLRVQWAPLVQVAQYELPRVEAARDEHGAEFKPTAGSRRSVRYGVGQSTRSATVQVHLEPSGSKPAETIATLTVELPIAGLQHDVTRVVLDDASRIPVCLGPDGAEAEPGTNESVRFHALDKSDDGRSQWVADLSATLLDPVPQRTVQVFMKDAQGRRERLPIYGGRSRSADGTVRLTARAWRSGTAKPAGLVVSWFRREEAGRLRFEFADVPLR